MPPLQPTQDEIRRLQDAQLAQAYATLFGDEAHRTPAQRLVWEDLKRQAYFENATWTPDLNDGKVCPYRAALTEGRRNLFLYVLSQVTLAGRRPPQPETQKPRRKR